MLPWRVRRAITKGTYVVFIAALGFYATRLYGHPIRSWWPILKKLPRPLQLPPLAAGAVKALKIGQAPPGSREAALKEFLDKRSDHLAARLKRSVADEQVKRGLLRPRPLDVQWRRVTRGRDPHGPVLIPRESSPAQPFDRVAGLYLDSRGRTRGNRVVIIGAPGSGKTAVTLSLQLGLLKAREKGEFDRVPIVLSLSTWNPGEEAFPAWAAARLRDLDPELKRTMKTGSGAKRSVADHLLDDERILLVLDAMDEMPADFLRMAFEEINKLDRWADQPLVVTCRTEDYRGSLVPGVGQELEGALVIELLPPSDRAMTAYLRSSGGAAHSAEWDAVLSRLRRHPDGPIWQVLDSPLMISLVGRIYGADPAGLERVLASGTFADAAALERHLLRALVPTTYAKAAGDERLRFRWRPDSAEKWLRFLAAWVQSRQGLPNQKHEKGSRKGATEPDNGQDIAWWRLPEAPQARGFARVTAGLFGGLAMGCAVALGIWGVFSNRYDPRVVTVIALAFGAVFLVSMSLDCARKTPPPTSNSFGWPRGNWGAPGLTGLFILIVAAAAGVFAAGTTKGIWWGPIVAAPAAAAYAFGTPYVDTSKVSTPRALYRSDIRQSLIYGVGYGVSLGVFAGIYHGWPIGLAMGLLAGIAGGFTYGLIYAMVFGMNISGVVAWLRFRMAHLWLAATGRLPWRLFAFLEDAHQLGILRQSGASYQFLHLRLRDELAEAEVEVEV
jgi:hypothetical protein